MDYQNLGSLLHRKQEVTNTATCLETAFLHFKILCFNALHVFKSE